MWIVSTIRGTVGYIPQLVNDVVLAIMIPKRKRYATDVVVSVGKIS